MEAFEYQIRKDIRNNPIVREVDHARVREFRRLTLGGLLCVVLFLFACWQNYELLRFGYRIEQLNDARATEEQVNRTLRLQVQALQRPQRIEEIARRQLNMKPPGPDDAIVIERVRPSDPPDRSVVALR
jgi:cell division protein FtsL